MNRGWLSDECNPDLLNGYEFYISPLQFGPDIISNYPIIYFPYDNLPPYHDLNGAFDINGDHQLDVIVGDSWFDGGASWAEHPIGGQPNFAADLDGDGDNELSGDEGWFENTDGAGTTWVLHSGQTGRPADLNHDGDMDLVSGSIWYENKLNGQVWETHSGAGGFPVDIDGDGDLDLVRLNGTDLVWVENVRYSKHAVVVSTGPTGGYRPGTRPGSRPATALLLKLFPTTITGWLKFGWTGSHKGP